jgi:hypothetical protein
MPNKPLLVFCLRRIQCPLVEVMCEAAARGGCPLGGNGSGDGFLDASVPPLAARVLRVAQFPGEGYGELWLRVSGGRDKLKAFSEALSRAKGIYHQVIHENKFNKILRVVLGHDAESVCPVARSGGCPLNPVLPGSMVKSVLVLPQGVLYELIVARSSVLSVLRNNFGCEILDSREVTEMDYMLTEKQELALIYAYFMGYYNFPRKVSLKDLAKKLGISVSTLAEFLRRAEAKVVEAYVRHELPHYMAAIAFYGPRCVEEIERMISGKREPPVAAKPAAKSVAGTPP